LKCPIDEGAQILNKDAMRKKTFTQRGMCYHMDMMIIIAVISIAAAILVPNFLKARKQGMHEAMKQEAFALAEEFNRVHGVAEDWRQVPAARSRAPMGALPPGEHELIYEIRRGAGAYEGGGKTRAHRFEIEGLRLYNLEKDEIDMGFHANFYMPREKEIHYIGSIMLNETGAPVELPARGTGSGALSLPASIIFCGDLKKVRVTIHNGGAVAETE